MKDNVFYGKYIVILMDILGQKEMYKVLEYPKYLHTDLEIEYKNKIVEFIRMIEHFKSDVDKFFHANENYKSKITWPKESRKFSDKTKINLCKTQRFSDGIMVYIPLGNTTDSIPISSVFTGLLCSASTMLTSLSRANPIRVGIGLGGGAEIDEGELFGPAIGYAHVMESERAIYPRIAIHENLIEYLNSHSSLINSKNVEDKFTYQIAEICKSMIKQDEDGEYIIDYLGDNIMEIYFGSVNKDLMKPAFEFIQREKIRFEKEKNAKLISKYKYLYEYFTGYMN